MKKILVVMFLVCLLMGLSKTSFALTILDSTIYANTSYTSGIGLDLAPGVYTVSVANGPGISNAWNPWGNIVNLPTQGWQWQVWVYSVGVSSGYGTELGNATLYSTAALAYAAHSSDSITINVVSNSGPDLYLYLYDGWMEDNAGAVALNVTPVSNNNAVPEPMTMLLVGSGLIGLGVYGKKKFFKK